MPIYPGVIVGHIGNLAGRTLEDVLPFCGFMDYAAQLHWLPALGASGIVLHLFFHSYVLLLPQRTIK
jgi:hypothetical protein